MTLRASVPSLVSLIGVLIVVNVLWLLVVLSLEFV